MKQFVVGFLSMFDNTIHLKQFSCSYPEQAVAAYLVEQLGISASDLEYLDMDAMEQLAANCDASISVLEINNGQII